MSPVLRTVEDVAARHLCTGCGVCAYLQPQAISMVDVPDEGRRPIVQLGTDTREAFSACPGASMAHPDRHDPAVVPALLDGWGPVLEVWEGHAADDEIRFRGSSGGAATALSLHAITDGGMHGVLHTAARADAPLLNQTVLSRTREQLLAGSGSRYAPASPCDGLQEIEDAPAPCVFIGKPCDVAAAHRARRMRPRLDERLGLTIAIFCAGTPSTRGTLEMVRRMGIADPADVIDVRYRGNGWPGQAQVQAVVDGQTVTRELTYEESWGSILQAHCQWRCRVCVDHTGEFADISVGDPWYRETDPDEPGRSLIVVRTQRGREVLQAAVASGRLQAWRVGDELLPASQPNLLRTRGAVWGRILISRSVGVAAPLYRNMPSRAIWMRELTTIQKVRSFTGTLKRIMTRRLHRRNPQPIDRETAGGTGR